MSSPYYQSLNRQNKTSIRANFIFMHSLDTDNYTQAQVRGREKENITAAYILSLKMMSALSNNRHVR